MKPDPSASKPETVEALESSKGSSSEVNSPVSLEKASIAESDKIQESFDSEEKACQTHNKAKDFAVGNSGVSKVHQLCVIITEAEEGNNSEGSKKVDRQVDKMKDHNKKEKEKVHVLAGEWRMITSAINHGTEVPEGSTREVLMGYQYALYQHKKKLREERDMMFQDNNSISREEYWEDYSEDSEYSRERRRDPKHNRGGGAAGPGAAPVTLGLFLLPGGRPGRRLAGASEEVPAVAGVVFLFLLPRGRPRPRGATEEPKVRQEPSASAMSTTEKPRKNPRWRKKMMRRRTNLIRVFTFTIWCFIYKHILLGPHVTAQPINIFCSRS
jgi:hypothetical protein